MLRLRLLGNRCQQPCPLGAISLTDVDSVVSFLSGEEAHHRPV